MKKIVLPILALSLLVSTKVYANETEKPHDLLAFTTTQIEETTENEFIENEKEHFALTIEMKNIEESITQNIQGTSKPINITNDIILPNTEDFINIKESADINSKSLAKLYQGSSATLIDYVDEEWIKVESGDIIGYVQSKKVVPTLETQQYIEDNINSYQKQIYTNQNKPIPIYATTELIEIDNFSYIENIVAKENVKVYESESMESQEIDKISNISVKILSINKNWACIEYGLNTGYVKIKDLTFNYNINNSCAIDVIIPGHKYEVLEYDDNYVKLENGYAKIDDLILTVAFNDAEKVSDFINIDVGGIPEGKQKEIVEFALQYLGNPYVWGGESLTEGVDCSGFTMMVYRNFGVTLPHNAALQINYGKRVELEDVQPGDLIFYGDSLDDIGHVGIYIGNNQLLHASTPSSGIKISQWCYREPLGAVRLIENN